MTKPSYNDTKKALVKLKQVRTELKFNPNHDTGNGQFSSGGGGSGGGGAPTMKDPQKVTTAPNAYIKAWNSYLTEKQGPLAPQQETAAKDYIKGPGSKDESVMSQTSYQINAALRSGADLGKNQTTFDNIKTAIDTHTLPADMTVYRGIDDPSTVAMLQNNVGKTFTDPGFTSTTLSYGHQFAYTSAPSGALVSINLPKGTPALYTQPYASKYSEYELILQHGSSFTVASYTPSPASANLTREQVPTIVLNYVGSKT